MLKEFASGQNYLVNVAESTNWLECQHQKHPAIASAIASAFTSALLFYVNDLCIIPIDTLLL